MTDIVVTLTPPPDINVTIGDVSSVSLLYTGAVARSMTAGELLVLGDICYVKAADGKLWKAKSNGTAAEAEAQFICSAAAGIAADVAGMFTALGFVTGLSGGTAGSIAFLATTYGASTTSVPSADYSKIVGRWVSTTVLYFQPDWATMRLS